MQEQTPYIQEDNAENVTAPDMFDEDFGKMKMEIFKQKCRNILGPGHIPYADQ